MPSRDILLQCMENILSGIGIIRLFGYTEEWIGEFIARSRGAPYLINIYIGNIRCMIRGHWINSFKLSQILGRSGQILN